MTVEIPQAAKTLIDEIIVNQEGGWKLTENKNDPDGGWTYAGVTAKTYNDRHVQGTPLDYYHMQIALREVDDRDGIYEIYYETFYLPLQLDKLPAILQGPLLSAAINIGVKEAVECLQKCLQDTHVTTCPIDGEMGSKTHAAIAWFVGQIRNHPAIGISNLYNLFLHQWTLHYCQLVEENAKAWHDWAEKIYDPMRERLNDGINKPSTFRANFLSGWINRVEYWRNK